ncbi:MAG: class I SAM-dependent methyltransferase [Selenomonadaceae bacterium]|nr:class I SAM-dependent methyltransferase [Selenomonadaceae bacterium]
MILKKFTAVLLAVFFVSELFFVSQTSAERPKPSSAVSYTAPISLYWLAKAGVPEAIEYLQYINAESILKPENISQYERVERINKIYNEIRYSSLNNFIESENYKNVLDLGCGVSPRCLYTAKKEINYTGTDLKDVVNVLNVYAPNFLKDDMKKYVRFVTADASNRNEMINSAKEFNGKICIVEEDLLMYLSRDKQKAMLKNIRDILKKNGGCFVTSDFVAGEIFMSIAKNIYGDEDALTLAKETQKIYEDISEMFFNETMFKSKEEAVKFIEDAGLKIEMRPIFSGTPNIRSIRDLNNRDIENINAMTQQKLLWIITVDDKK